MNESGRWPFFKVYDTKLSDMTFFGLSNTEWGVFHKLECLANQQPNRGIIQLPPELFWQALAKNLNIRTDHVEKYLNKFKERGFLDYSMEEGWIDFIYFKQQQKPLSDADRKRRQRERERSRQSDENVTEGVTQKKREEYIRKENSGVTGPTPSRGDGGADQPLTSKQMVAWLKDLSTMEDSVGIKRTAIGAFKTFMERRTEAERQEIIEMAADQRLTIPEDWS